MSQSRPSGPAPLIRVLAAVAGLALVAAAVVLSTSAPAAASGLEAFGSCGELEQYLGGAGADVGEGDGGGEVFYETGAAIGTTGAPTADRSQAAAGDSAAGAGAGSARDDGTNTQVAGIDELDIVEALADGRMLVVRDDRVLVLQPGGVGVADELPTPPGTEISADEERGIVWAVASDGLRTTLTRVALDADGFGDPSTWSVAGSLVDLRRSGDTVHLVAVDQDLEMRAQGDAIPFDGTSPVPCDEVLHAMVPGGAATTLVARFSASGALEPTAATEIVGAGDNVLVTDESVYVSTPSWDEDRQVTGIHRFDPADLRHTGSGSMVGRLINQFALDEHDGHLRAAITHDGGGFIGRPMPVDGVGVVEGDVATASAAGDASEPPVTEPTDTTLPEPTTTVVEPPESSTTSTTIEATTTTVETSTTEAPTTTTSLPATAPLNEIVTLDVDGALDVVGRTPRFGHEGETLHGIRFAGEVAYAVTFLQTDPLYVIDLSDPATPRVLGELEIPGFSAYLHPISPTRVIGFGPGPDGTVLARLFDVADPSAPRLVDTVDLGADSPIAYDHHALRTDGDRLVVAANDYVTRRPDDCPSAAAAQTEVEALYREIEAGYAALGDKAYEEMPPELMELQARADELSQCAWGVTFPQARIVTLTPTGESLGLDAIETTAGDAQRVLPLADGYLVVGTTVTLVDLTGAAIAQVA